MRRNMTNKQTTNKGSRNNAWKTAERLSKQAASSREQRAAKVVA
jgi:hypothetical protein